MWNRVDRCSVRVRKMTGGNLSSTPPLKVTTEDVRTLIESGSVGSRATATSFPRLPAGSSKTYWAVEEAREFPTTQSSAMITRSRISTGSADARTRATSARLDGHVVPGAVATGRRSQPLATQRSIRSGGRTSSGSDLSTSVQRVADANRNSDTPEFHSSWIADAVRGGTKTTRKRHQPIRDIGRPPVDTTGFVAIGDWTKWRGSGGRVGAITNGIQN